MMALIFSRRYFDGWISFLVLVLGDSVAGTLALQIEEPVLVSDLVSFVLSFVDVSISTSSLFAAFVGYAIKFYLAVGFIYIFATILAEYDVDLIDGRIQYVRGVNERQTLLWEFVPC